MGDFITILILVFAIACISLLIYSKVKEIRGKSCAGCDRCGSCEGCSLDKQKGCNDAVHKQ